MAVSVGKIEQEDGNSFFGAHAAEQKHDVLVARDLSRQEAVEILLQRHDGSGQRFESVERQRAYLRILQRDCLAAVRQPLAFQPGNHSVMPLSTYRLSTCSFTAQGRLSACRPWMTAINSMRLLVVTRSPP